MNSIRKAASAELTRLLVRAGATAYAVVAVLGALHRHDGPTHLSPFVHALRDGSLFAPLVVGALFAARRLAGRAATSGYLATGAASHVGNLLAALAVGVLTGPSGELHGRLFKEGSAHGDA
jgi:hypothetical protein